jgi:putative Holliday junction resolvase
VKQLKTYIPDAEIIFEDERFTSQIAQERLSQIFKSKKRIKNKVDAISAVVILESYLEKNPL